MNTKYWMTIAAALCLGMTAFACGGDEEGDENTKPEVVADAGIDVTTDSGVVVETDAGKDETPDAGHEETPDAGDEETPTTDAGGEETPVLEKGMLKVSQIYLCGYGATGNPSAADSEFIEFVNAGTSDINVAEYTFVYGGKSGKISSTHSFYDGCANGKCIVKPGEYFVFKTDGCDNDKLAEDAKTVTPDATMGEGKNMNIGSNGMYALIHGGAPDSETTCAELKAKVDDLVGLGSQACFEGSASAKGLDNTNTGVASYQRNNGSDDTDDNAADFSVANVVVR